MSEVIESADQLMDLLAGDDEEVPSTLIRKGSNSSKHEEAVIDQAKLSQLNKVEEWMKSENAAVSDKAEFISLGETLFTSLAKSKSLEVSASVTQKLTKLALLWVKVSKSCKLVESDLKAEHISSLVGVLVRSKSPNVAVQEVCGRMLLAMVQCSPSRLFVDKEVVSAFNKLVQSWCKGTFKGNAFTLLNLFPIEFLAQLKWVPSSKPFIVEKVLSLVARIAKRNLRPLVDVDEFVDSVASHKGTHAKELEEQCIKLGGVLSRSKLELPTKYREWLSGLASRDLKAEKVSAKNTRLAKTLLASLEHRT